MSRRNVRNVKRPRNPRKPRYNVDATLPVPPMLERVPLAELSSNLHALEVLDEWDRSRHLIRILEASLKKCGIKLVGVDAVALEGLL